MNFIKVNGQFINLDNVVSIKFETLSVTKLAGKWWYASTYDKDARESFTAIISVTNADESILVIDAEPLKVWLNKISVDVADGLVESEALELYRYGIRPQS